MESSDCTLFDFDEIYNQNSTYVAPDDENRRLMNSITMKRHSIDTICNLDDFPFAQSKIYARRTSEPRRSPPIRRAYEEAYLVEGVGNEGCTRGDACECVSMFGFTLRRFDFPELDCGGQCLLCIRVGTLALHLHAEINDIQPHRSIQPYRNIIGVAGEYSERDCISVTIPGSEPFILHVREKYTEEIFNGLRRVIQSGYSDFRTPPPGPH